MVLREDPRQAEFGKSRSTTAAASAASSATAQPTSRCAPYMFAGVHVLEPRFLEYIPPDVNTCINRYAYIKALSNDEVLGSYVSDGYFADAGTPMRYYQANADALDAGDEAAPRRSARRLRARAAARGRRGRAHGHGRRARAGVNICRRCCSATACVWATTPR